MRSADLRTGTHLHRPIASQSLIDLMARYGDGLSPKRVGTGPKLRQFIQGASLPTDFEDQGFSSFFRWARTSSVVYQSLDFALRSNSSSLTSGETGSQSDMSTCGLNHPNTRPPGSHNYTISFSPCSLPAKASSSTIWFISVLLPSATSLQDRGLLSSSPFYFTASRVSPWFPRRDIVGSSLTSPSASGRRASR